MQRDSFRTPAIIRPSLKAPSNFARLNTTTAPNNQNDQPDNDDEGEEKVVITREYKAKSFFDMEDWHWKDNLVASINVAFVNFPMNMSFATASNLSPAVGIVSAFWGGLFTAFADTRYCVLTMALNINLLTRPMVTQYKGDGYLLCLSISGAMMWVILRTNLY